MPNVFNLDGHISLDFTRSLLATSSIWRVKMNLYHCFFSRASSAVLSKMILQKYFSHPSLVIYFFPTQPRKPNLGLQIGGRLLIAAHLDQSNNLADQQQVLDFAMPFTSLSIMSKKQGQNHFPEPKPECYDFSSLNLLCKAM
jgi:hypothetical protein